MNPTHDPKKCITLDEFCREANKVLVESGDLPTYTCNVIGKCLDFGGLYAKESNVENPKSYRLTCEEFSVVCELQFGSCEGIYVEVYLVGKWRHDQKEDGRLRVGVFKSDSDGRDMALTMGKICGAIPYHLNRFINSRIEDFMGGGKGKEG